MTKLQLLALFLAACLLQGNVASTLFAQLLPPVETGVVPVSATTLLDHLPVNFYTNRFDVTFYFGPTDLAAVPGEDNRLVVTSHNGQAFLLDNQGNVTSFLDLATPDSPTYSPWFAATPIQGMTSLVFHPDFAEPTAAGYRKFYTLEPESLDAPTPADFDETIVVANVRHHEVLYEYSLSNVDDTTCDANCFANRRELLRINQPGIHHNLGDLAFGSDGMLFVSSGDGDNAANATLDRVAISENSVHLDNIFGKILRIDPFGSNSTNGQYGIPADNPFVDGDGPNIDEIYAYGLRNPYRLAVDAKTGELYSSETGQLNVESIKRIEAGGHHGWNLMEGSFIYNPMDQSTVIPDQDLDGDGTGDFAAANGLVEPVLEYDRQTGWAVIGMAAYRGSEWPELDGKLIFADHVLGKLFYGDPETDLIRQFELDESSDPLPGRIFGVATDNDGDLYVYGITSHNANGHGIVQKLSRPWLAGDFDRNNELDVTDLDQLRNSIIGGGTDATFDLNGDEVASRSDIQTWIKTLKGTFIGDANLNGKFNSEDLVIVFAAGEYDDGVAGNSTWDEGDWNADGEFDSSDLVFAFQDNGYDAATVATIAPVPEPQFGWFAWFLVLFVCRSLVPRNQKINT
ncbi:MAG: PQQ-dependent sugar dehydrogenase [Pirellulaceae bacterium]